MACCNAGILSVLLNGAETWISYAYQLKRLQSFHARLRRKVLDTKWQDKVTNLEVHANSNQKCIETIIGMKSLKWLQSWPEETETLANFHVFLMFLMMSRRKRTFRTF